MSLPWDAVPPAVVGGTGGSGTRVATKVLLCGGVFMGAHLNVSGDSLDLAQFDASWGKRYLDAERSGARAPTDEMRAALPGAVAAHLDGREAASGPWGWKDPPSYLLLPWLDSVIANLRFVHFVRDGRRMAFSHNQRQPQHYGEVVFGAEREQWPPHVLALQFWSWANARAADYGEQHMHGRYLRVRFEDVCAEPQRLCRQIIDFARADGRASDAQVAAAAELIATPSPPKLDRKRLAQVHSLEVPSLARFGYV